MTVAEKFDAALVQSACEQALLAAKKAAKAFYDAHGDRDACGFAFVHVYGVRSNSRLGRTLASYGFRRDYTGGLCLWNPSQAGVQSVSVLEAGAEAYAQVLKTRLGLERCYAGSRLD